MAEGDLELFRSLFSSKGQGADPVAEDPAERLDPLLVPGCEILERLGAGGMGAVYKARQIRMDRPVAIKFLKRELADDPEYVQRFLVEARTAGRLRHMNIVSALDCGTAKDRHFMVMEFVEGKPLDMVMKERGLLDERIALEIVRQAADGLDYAWRHGFIHRDIKPQNIMMTPEGVAKICDLGLCKSVRSDAKLTSTGYVNCTPSHASPEQARADKGLDCRTDIYSLGITFYQLVTGTLPFDAVSPADYFVKHATAERVPPSSRNSRVSKEVNDLILRMIDPEASKRLPNPAAVVGEIRRIQALPLVRQAGESAKPPPVSQPPPPAPSLLERFTGVEDTGPLTVAIEFLPDCAVIHLQGKLLESLDRIIVDAVNRVIEKREARVVVDCEGLQYLNSRGVSVFIAMADVLRERGGDLKLAAVAKQAHLILDRLGVSLILQSLPRVDDAIAAFRQGAQTVNGFKEPEKVAKPPSVLVPQAPHSRIPPVPRPDDPGANPRSRLVKVLSLLVAFFLGGMIVVAILVARGTIAISLGK